MSATVTEVKTMDRLVHNFPNRKTPLTMQRQELKEKMDSGQKTIIDLDEIVERWVWKMWEMSKRREDSKYRREELDIEINWKRVNFWQSETIFNRSQQLRMPKSQILFKTHFTNNTDREQDYSLRAERSTVTTFNFTFMKGFTKEKEGAVTFKLPNEVVEVGGGIKHEQRVDYGKDTTFETRMTWSADSNIRVAPHSRANAELIITEEEYSADFQVEVRFSGRISASICSRRDNNAYVKFVEGDMAAIFQDAIKTSNASQFEIFDNSIVRTIMSGKCAFRYGVEQHVTVEQDRLTSASEPPPRYHAIITNSH